MKHRRGLGGKGTLRAAWRTVVDALEALARREGPARLAAREGVARLGVGRVPRKDAVGDRDDLVAAVGLVVVLVEGQHRRVVHVVALVHREALVDVGRDLRRGVLALRRRLLAVVGAEEVAVAAGDVAVAPVERTGVSCQAHRKREAGRGART